MSQLKFFCSQTIDIFVPVPLKLKRYSLANCNHVYKKDKVVDPIDV